MSFIPNDANGNCSNLFSGLAIEAHEFFEFTKAASKGDPSFSKLLELAALLNEEVHNVGFQKSGSELQGTVGEFAEPRSESTSALMHFYPTFTDAPKVAHLGTTELRKLIARVEISEAISKVVKFIAYELAGVKLDGIGAPPLTPSSQAKQSYVENKILPEFKKLTTGGLSLKRVSQHTLNLIANLEGLPKADGFHFSITRMRYGLTNKIKIYDEIYDRLARDLITGCPELPKSLRKKLLKLTLNPEPELIAKTEVQTQKHSESIFEEKWTHPTSDTFTAEEIHSGKSRGVIFQKTNFIGGEKVAIPVTLLKALPESKHWLVASTSQLSSKFRDRVEIYKVPFKELSISNFPESIAQTQFDLSEKEPNPKLKYDSILIDSETGRESKEAKLSFVLNSLGVTKPLADEKPSEPSEPMIVSRYPNYKNIESAKSFLRASIAREFLLTKGGRELRATTADLNSLETFFTLNSPETSTDGASPIERAQIESIKQSKEKFRKRIEVLEGEIKTIREEYGISDIASLIEKATTKEAREELFKQLGTRFLEIEERLENLSEASKEKLVLGAVHAELEVELFKFAGPKKKEKAEKWLVDKRTETNKKTPALLRAFFNHLPEAERDLAKKHINPNAFKMESVIKPGETAKFLMGSPNNEGGRSGRETQKEVVLTSPVLFQATDTTQAQYADVIGGNPSKFKDASRLIKINGIEVDPNRPVEQVSWWSAVFYCNERSKKEGLEPVYDFAKVKFTGDAQYGTLDGTGEVILNKKAKGYRLPTEAEWEYATRAGTTTRYSFGDEESDLPQHGYDAKNSGGKTQPVAQLKPNNFGLYDMHGNVWKWTEDWYSNETPGGTDPTDPVSGSNRVIRGGSWASSPQSLRSAYRSSYGPGNRYYALGFRVVRTP